MLFISKPAVTFSSPQKNNVAKGVGLFFLLYILNSIFSFWEWDTYHSWWGFLEAQKANYDVWEYEPIYNWLAKITNNNYFLWRTLIWMPACMFVLWVARRLEILNRNFLLSITLFLAFLYCTRNLLGLSMLLFGLALLIDNNSHAKLWGIAFIIASYFFHKTMYIAILFAVLALFPQNKKSIVILLLLFPLFTMAATYVINNIVSVAWVSSLGVSGEEGNRVVLYIEKERVESTLFGVLRNVITYFPQYLALFYVTKRIVFNNILEGDKRKKIWYFLCKFSFVCIYVASTFYFTETSYWIYERFKYMGMVPLTFVIAKVWSLESKTNNWVKALILFQLLSLSYRWIDQYWHWA